jgi:hypothetical protein
MEHFFKKTAVVLAMAVVLSQTVAFSADSHSSIKKPPSLVEWVKTHPNATVEYQYPSLRLAQAAATATTIKLKNGTPAVIRLTDTVSANSASVGSSVSFKMVGDTKINGKVVIRDGEMGTAQVTTAVSNGMIGQAGKLIISDFGTHSVDGSFVPLRSTLTNEGKSKMGPSVVVSVLICPLFLLMKGGEAQAPAGTEKTVYVAADVDVAI